MIRVLIADDQPLVRRGLALILGPDPEFEVVGEAEDGARAVALAHEVRPDVVVMDIRMPVMDGVKATEELARTLPETRVLALSTFDMDEYVVAALRAGAYGFLPKDVSPEELIAAVRIVHTGEAAVAPRLLSRLLSAYVRTPARPRSWAAETPSNSPRASWRSGGSWPPAGATPRWPRNWTSASPRSRTTSPASLASWACATVPKR